MLDWNTVNNQKEEYMAHEGERLIRAEEQIRQLETFKQDMEQRMRSIERVVYSGVAITIFIQIIVGLWVTYHSGK